MKIQIYCNRGQGWTQDGCWGGENAECDSVSDAVDLIIGLMESYPDCRWGYSDDDGATVTPVTGRD